LASVPRVSLKKAQQIVAARAAVDVDEELAFAEKLGVDIVTLESQDYPAPLRKIHGPPPVLYVRGALSRADGLALAIVGSRTCSQYGYEQASRLAHLLAGAGFTIVSGLARGIDAAAHRGALAAAGRTIAVQGCGLARTYPSDNADLAQEIARTAAVISEFPLRYEPLPTTFPMRNRIISGLALGVIVVEARPGSGALITARQATDQNREVMAVPGRIDAPGSIGPHRLIKDGAKLVENVTDVMDALGYIGDGLQEHAAQTAEQITQAVEQPNLFDPPQLPLSETEAAVFDAIDTKPTPIDDLVTQTRLPVSQINATLTSLQLKGIIKQLPGSYYQKRTKR